MPSAVKKPAVKKPAVKTVKPAPKKAVAKAAAKKAVAKAAAKKAAPKKKAAPAGKAAAKKAAPKKAALEKAAPNKKAAPASRGRAGAMKPGAKMAPRADYGAPIDGFFAKQAPAIRPIAEALRALIEAAVPTATSSIKWGMPFYQAGDTMLCAIGGHKAHVNLILSGPPGTFEDPDGLLQGDGKTGRHLKLRSLEELPRERVKAWLKKLAALGRG